VALFLYLERETVINLMVSVVQARQICGCTVEKIFAGVEESMCCLDAPTPKLNGSNTTKAQKYKSDNRTINSIKSKKHP